MGFGSILGFLDRFVSVLFWVHTKYGILLVLVYEILAHCRYFLRVVLIVVFNIFQNPVLLYVFL